MADGRTLPHRDRQREQTRLRFVATAMRLFEENGYAGTTMQQIAREAGGSRANLYLHFRNKPELILERMRQVEPEILAGYRRLDALPVHDRAHIRAWLEESRGLWEKHCAEFGAMEQAMGEDRAVADEWLAMMRRMAGALTTVYAGCATPQDRRRRAAHLVTLMMGLDRSFYFLVVRGADERDDDVLDSLAQLWETLYL